MQLFKERISFLVSSKLKIKEDLLSLIEIPPDSKLGDLSLPCFNLAKTLKKSPVEISKELSNIQDVYFSKIESKGPYLNFFINPGILSSLILREILKKKAKYGSINIGKKEPVLIDCSSPNIAKPFSIGHLRSTIIGYSLYKIYNFLNFRAKTLNHLGDYGTQFGKLIVAYKKYGSQKELKKSPIRHLLEIYVKFHKQAESNPDLEEEARKAFFQLESGSKEYIKLWKKFSQVSLKEFNKIYKLLDVKFDYTIPESFYNSYLKSTISLLSHHNLLKEDNNAAIIDLSEFNLPPALIKKSDSSSLYITRDLASLLYRINKLKSKRILYVVGSEQSLHFEQLFAICNLLNLKVESHHIKFGLIMLPEGRMSTRKGNIIFLEDVFNKLKNLASGILKEKGLSKNKAQTAKIIATASLIYADLSNDRINTITFDWNRILDFNGNSAPYIQYTNARALSILSKQSSNQASKQSIDFSKLNNHKELALIKHLSLFQEKIIQSYQSNKPHIIANYSHELCQIFNEFYHECPVLKSQKDLKDARLSLVKAFAIVLSNAMSLLNIKLPKKM